jgi:hypothetical protein
VAEVRALTQNTYAPIGEEGLQHGPLDAFWGTYLGMAMPGPSDELPSATRLQPHESWIYVFELAALSDESEPDDDGRSASIAPPAELTAAVEPDTSTARTLVTVQPAAFLSSTYSNQFWKGWTLITSVELSILTITMLVPKDWTGWHDDFIEDGVNNLRRAWSSPPTMDDDHWFHNYVGHPYGGNVYYNTVRSQGATPTQSFLFSAFMSAQWEYFFEAVAEQPSIQDLIITPTTGAVLGELVHRLTLRMKKNGTNLFEKAFILLANPTHVVMVGY